jgi:hypothetical protein
MPRRRARLALLAPFALACATLGRGQAPFTIEVVDEAGRAVPCVRLATTNQIVLTTDRRGRASFEEPGLMGEAVFFTPSREGYAHAADAAGIRGAALRVTPGGIGRVTLAHVGPTPGCDAVEAQAFRALSRRELFRIDAVDAASGRGVPLVTLRETSGASWVSDSAGVIAFDDRAAMGRKVAFEVESDGYRPLAPGGKIELEPAPGGRATIPLDRVQIAERLYRVTGAGIYRDSVRLGLDVPIRHPLVNAGVAGQDSVQAAVYRGRVFWIWGDTPSLAHPLRNFHATGAASQLPQDGGLDPARGVDLEYFTDRDGSVRALASIPGPGATWLGALVNVPDARGEETLLALYGKHVEIEPPAERGIARFDPRSGTFVRALVLAGTAPAEPHGTAHLAHGADGVFVHYGDDVRAPARAESVLDPASWESFTPFPAPGAAAERGRDGAARYAWRRGAPPVREADVRGGRLAPAEALFGHLRDFESGRGVADSAPSTAANAFRSRFVRVFTERGGSPSRLGEVWYAEADTPMGPWRFARRIASHRRHSFYNPFHHVFFDQRGGRTIFFEGTYTTLFSDAAEPTPRYDYNQIMHRLDLEDPRLALPVPIYEVAGRGERFAEKRDLHAADGDPPVAVFAHDRPAAGSVPVWWSGAACGARRLVAGGAPRTAPLFYAYAQDAPPAAPARMALRVDPKSGAPTRSGAPLAFVFENPLRVRLPVGAYLPAALADAGPDLCLREERAGEGALATLDASRSGASARRYAWRWQGGSAAGVRAQVRLAAGLHDVRLEVEGEGGEADEDALVIEVAPALAGG